MDSQHNFFIIALLFVSLMIWQTWQVDHKNIHAKKKQNNNFEHKINNLLSHNISSVCGQQNKFITVETDVLSLKINTCGGDIEEASLLTYPEKLNSTKPFHLLETSKNFIYQAQSGLISKNSLDNTINNNRLLFTTNNNSYILASNQNEIHVPMTYTSPDGSIYKKIFILKRNNFALKIIYNIKNNGSQPLELSLYGQLKQSIYQPKKTFIDDKNFTFHTYRGAAYSSSGDKYQKYSFKDIKKENLKINTKRGWVAMLQQYFAAAWIPCTNGENILYSNIDLNNNQAIIGFKSTPTVILPKTRNELKAILWIGPEIQNKMAKVAPYLDLTVDYGWLWFMCQPLFKILKFIHKYIGNWGFSIIIITFIVRSITYPLTKAQYTSIAKMRMLQPKLIKIRERSNNDKQRFNKEIMDLYKTEKVNPLGGCLPLIIQMPIFLALYYMLSSSIELRHAPFVLWIHDLSSQDPYYILPIIMGFTMFFIQKISPNTTNDLIQKKIMTFMPLIFIIFFLWFPSGLVLYYIISNIVTIIQQQLIYNHLNYKK